MTIENGYDNLKIERSKIIREFIMNNYLIDEEILEKIVEQIIAESKIEKSADELASFKKEKMEELDDKIGMAVLGELNQQQLKEFDELLDGEDDSEEIFKEFFMTAGVDVEEKAKEVIMIFKEEFLKEVNG